MMMIKHKRQEDAIKNNFFRGSFKDAVSTEEYTASDGTLTKGVA
jgi:hypothetical protein